MNTFPSLAPNKISYDLGSLNTTEIKTFAGPILFRHSLQVTANTLRLSYVGLTQTQKIGRAHV